MTAFQVYNLISNESRKCQNCLRTFTSHFHDQQRIYGKNQGTRQNYFLCFTTYGS
jgi:hypothetical protein